MKKIENIDIGFKKMISIGLEFETLKTCLKQKIMS